MAIAFDAQGGLDADSGTTHTWTHVVTGSNMLLLVGGRNTYSSGGDDVTGVTYNGVAMTRVSAINIEGNDWDYLYYLIAPATGSHSVVVSSTHTTNGYWRSASYSGVKQTGFPDASNTGSAGSGTSITASITTSADNSWLAALMDNEVNTTSAAAGTTYRNGALTTVIAFGDSNAAKTPAGAYSLGMTWSGSGSNSFSIVSFAPVVAAATSTKARIALMGVGI